ncbi:MAG: NACHT domain-containing protein [Deltaproteobacteria bacterium]|nr:NACHT domain-containing protein [Deltaproteobacteria bacterium]
MKAVGLFIGLAAWVLWSKRKDIKEIAGSIGWLIRKLSGSSRETTEDLTAVGTSSLYERDDLFGLSLLRKKVRNAWIHGLLDESLSNRPTIELTKELVHAQVAPLLSTAEYTNEPSPRASSAKTLKIFEKSNSSLLILGEPGAGKTTELLVLANDLITAAETVLDAPVPLVLNLSSWRKDSQDLFTWLCRETARQYQISPRFTAAWLTRNRLILLLDGLDQVSPTARYSCLTAINEFIGKYGVVGIAVCSRLAEYSALAAHGKLKLNAAIRLRPLSDGQINDYLRNAGSASLSGLLSMLEEDSVLRALSQNPLMLSIMTRAYEDLPAQALNQEELDTPAKRRSHIFSIYVDRLFASRAARSSPYSETSIRKYLAWLAAQTKDSAGSVFFIEGLQPTWLGEWPSRGCYLLLTRLIGCMLFVAPVLIGVCLLHNVPQPTATFDYFVGGLLGVLTIAFAVAVSDAVFGMVLETWTDRGPFKRLTLVSARVLTYIALASVLLPFVLNVLSRILNRPIYHAAASLFLTALIAILLWSIRNSDGTLHTDVRTAEVVRLSVAGALRGLLAGALSVAAAVVLVIPLLMASVSALGLTHFIDIMPSAWLPSVWQLVSRDRALFLKITVFFASLGAVTGSLQPGLRATKNRPNEGIVLTAKNALLVTFAIAAVLLIAPDTAGRFGSFIGPNRATAIQMSVAIGVAVGAYHGGLDIIEHYIIRLILYIRDLTPLRYSRFLDSAARLTFLRKVGGGYIFMHPLMADYFATSHERHLNPG